MLQTNDNIFRMWDGVLQVFDNNPGKWGDFKPLAEAVVQLKAFRQSATDAGRRQQQSDTGTAAGKGSISDEMVALAGLLLGNAHAWAVANKDTALEENTDIADSTLSRKSGGERADAIDAVVSLLTPYVNRLEDYRVTEASLRKLADLAGTFRKGTGEQGGHTAEHATATQTADHVRREGQLLLKKTVDKLMRNLKDSDPGFYSDYKNARVIRDTGGGKHDATPPAAKG